MSTENICLIYGGNLKKIKLAMCSNDHMSLVYTTSYPEIMSLLPWAVYLVSCEYVLSNVQYVMYYSVQRWVLSVPLCRVLERTRRLWLRSCVVAATMISK